MHEQLRNLPQAFCALVLLLLYTAVSMVFSDYDYKIEDLTS